LQSAADEKVFDLGEVILLPGLVNAHCHLDYTDMAGELPPPKTFTDWIPLITAAKTAWSYSEYARSWLHGAHMLLKTGTTTVADIEAMPDLLPEVWDATPLRRFFISRNDRHPRRRAQRKFCARPWKIDSLAHARCSRLAFAARALLHSAGIAPQQRRLARKRNGGHRTHVAESEEEFEMFTHARGKMFDWLKRNERDNSDCGLGSPVKHLARNKMLGENLLAIHVNCLARGDAAARQTPRDPRRPLPAQPRLFSPSAISARTPRQRRRQPLPRHRQPRHRRAKSESKSPN
jgi:aminodeoxyfutalosine deaminase